MTIANVQFKLARTTHAARKRSQLVVLGRAIRRGKVRSGRSDGPEAHLELEALARAVHDLLSHSPSGTVVTVLGDGSSGLMFPRSRSLPGNAAAGQQPSSSGRMQQSPSRKCRS